MSKGLEALERIGKCYVKSESKDLMFTDDYGDDYDIIERELKALEIIKNKRVDTFYLVYCFNCGGLERYNRHAQKYHMGTLKKEEFDLLKEVLCNDK